MVLIQTKKGSIRGGNWNSYSYESVEKAIPRIRKALNTGYRVKVMGREVLMWDSKYGFIYKK